MKHTRKTMITISVKDYNQISQDFYESIINSLQFHRLPCSCGHHACLTIHGYYKRGVYLPDGTRMLKVCRVKCSECGRTHALLLSSIVPYSRIRTSDQQAIIIAYETASGTGRVCDENPSIDEKTAMSVVRRYLRFWKQRLLSEGVSLTELGTLIRGCFSYYSMQFMQVRCTFNQLFPSPT